MGGLSSAVVFRAASSGIARGVAFASDHDVELTCQHSFRASATSSFAQLRRCSIRRSVFVGRSSASLSRPTAARVDL